MTILLLIRHADTDAIGNVLAGWTMGWHLNERGKQQAARLAGKLASLPLAAVYTSPLERAIETAEAIAQIHGIDPRQVEDLGEVRVGEWEGKSFAELDTHPDWVAYNTMRGGVRPPGGELMIECQMRMVRQVERLTQEHPDDTIAIVSHGDPIRSLITYFLGIPIDLFQRFEISPGSLSIAQLTDAGPYVLCVNRTEEFPA
jgi:probable phosphomutase (TIGR03848 family)